jgi:hypothetical protein
MRWDVFQAWLEALKRRNEGQQSDPYSWRGHEQDSWWAEARAKRDAMRGR